MGQAWMQHGLNYSAILFKPLPLSSALAAAALPLPCAT